MQRSLAAVAALIACSILLAAPPARAGQIRTLDAELQDDVVAIEGEGDAAVLRTSSGKKIPVNEVKEVRLDAAEREPRPAPVRVYLTTGDEVAGEITRGDDAGMVVRSPSLGDLTISLDVVRAIAFTGDDAELRRFRKEVLPIESKQDVAITRSWARQEGVLERVDEKGIAFTTGALGTVPLGADKIIGVRVRLFGKPPAPPKGLRARVDLADGGVVLGRITAMRQGNMTVEGALGKALELRAGEVRTLSFLGGRIVYVSDLQPAEVEETAKEISSDVRAMFKHRADANVLGNPLRLDGRAYRKGFGVHAYTRLVFKLDGGYQRFRATIGLDDEARERKGARGSVKFQVLVDGKPALGPDGALLSTRDGGKAIDVDVAGGSTLALIADFGDTEDTLARGVWADAFLVKK